MIDFQNASFLKLKPVPYTSVMPLLQPLFIEGEQVGRAVVIFPVEGDLGGAVELPFGQLDRQRDSKERRGKEGTNGLIELLDLDLEFVGGGS